MSMYFRKEETERTAGLKREGIVIAPTDPRYNKVVEPYGSFVATMPVEERIKRKKLKAKMLKKEIHCKDLKEAFGTAVVTEIIRTAPIERIETFLSAIKA